jgi:hypothetical protein
VDCSCGLGCDCNSAGDREGCASLTVTATGCLGCSSVGHCASLPGWTVAVESAMASPLGREEILSVAVAVILSVLSRTFALWTVIVCESGRAQRWACAMVREKPRACYQNYLRVSN